MTPALRLAAIWIFAIPVGIGVFALTNLAEPALPNTLNFGTEYGQMATDPFGLIGNFPHRILAPLVAHVLGYTGPAYAQFAHGCTIVLIAMLFAAAMLRGARWWQALLVTLAVAFTGTVQLYKGHVGYPDPITFALLLATIVAAKRPVLFWVLQALNVFHHEQVLFFWPWLAWWRWRENREAPDGWCWRRDVAGAALVLAAYVAWRYWVGANATGQKLTIEHYSALDYFPWGTLGLSILNVVSTFMWFGVMPLLIVWHAFRDGWRRAGWPIVFWLASIFAIFTVAHDVYRFTCFLFVPLFFAALRLLRTRGGALILIATTGLSIVAIEWQMPVFAEVGAEVLYDLRAAGGPQLRPHPVADILPKVVPALPWHFVAYGAAALATLLIGWLWARANRCAVRATAENGSAGTY